MTHIPHSIVSAIMFGLACSSVASQQILIVGSGGYPSITDALFAAAPGDTIRVQSGAYQSLNMRIGVNIVADPGTTVRFFEVNSIPAGQTARIYGLELVNPTVGGSRVMNNPGTVIIENCTWPPSSAWTQNRVWNNAAVICKDSEISLDAQWSSIVLDGCMMQGKSDLFGGWPAVTATNSRVSVAGSVLRGGEGSVVGAPGPAVTLNSSTLMLSTRAANSGLFAGTSGTPAAAAAIDGTGSVLTHPGAQLVANGGSMPIVGPIATVEPSLAELTTSSAPIGGTLTIDGKGPPLAFYMLAVGFVFAPTTLPAVTGDLWLASPILSNFGPFNAAGNFQQTLAIPAQPLLLGFTFAHQLVVLSPTNQLVVSTPTVTVLR